MTDGPQVDEPQVDGSRGDGSRGDGLPSDGLPSDGLPSDGLPVDRKMLEALVCPLSHGLLHYDAERGELSSKSAGLAFPIRDGIPIMLVSEARSLA